VVADSAFSGAAVRFAESCCRHAGTVIIDLRPPHWGTSLAQGALRLKDRGGENAGDRALTL